MERDVVITGIGVVSALGCTAETLHSQLCAGRRALKRRKMFGGEADHEYLCSPVEDFVETRYFGSANLRPLNRTAKLLIAATQSALEQSGHSKEMRKADEIGLVVGTMYCSMHTISEFDRRSVVAGPGYASAMDFANTVINAAAGQAAIWCNLRGVNITVSGGSAAGLQAISYAADLIRSDNADVVVAAGVEELCFESLFSFERAGLLSTQSSPLPFDLDRDGFGVGEGTAVVVLEARRSAGQRGARILGEVRGSALGFDSSRGLDAQKAAAAVSRCVEQAMEQAGVGPEEIDFVSAAGNGSIAGDRNEAFGLAAALNGRAATIPVTAIKSFLGDALGASAPIALISSLETLRTSMLPAVGGFRSPDPDCPLRNICTTPRPIGARVCLQNATSFDGQCASLVLMRSNDGS